MGRAERVDEKNVVICLLIIFTPGVMVTEMSKMIYFLLFSADDSKKLVTVWVNYSSASGRSYFNLLENAMDY